MESEPRQASVGEATSCAERMDSAGNWMDGMERFFAMADSTALVDLKEVRVVREREGTRHNQVLLVIGAARIRTYDALCSAARAAFPGWPVRVIRRIEPALAQPDAEA